MAVSGRNAGTWRNWAGNMTVTPARWYRPDSADGIAEPFAGRRGPG